MPQKQVSGSFQSLEYLDIGMILQDSTVCSRCEFREDVVADYASAMLQGSQFQPVLIYFDGRNYWLVDGFHRVQAQKAIGDLKVLADVWQGSYRDALLHATGVNISSGLKLTKADIRKNIHKLIGDPEWRYWSDLDIALQCGSTEDFVLELRVERMRGFFERAADKNRNSLTSAVIHPSIDLERENLFDLESALNGDAESFGPLITDQFLSVWGDMVIDKFLRGKEKQQRSIQAK